MEHRSFLDQMGNLVTINYPPRRIVSLVPSQTELLSDLNLDEEVVGITKFCIHPKAWLSPKKITGGTKNFNFDVIAALEPDLIIGNKEENYEEGINLLKQRFPVWLSDITTLEDSLAMITSLGEVTDRKLQSENIVAAIVDSFSKLRRKRNATVLYLIWKNPWMAVGRGTFIDAMLDRVGLQNVVPEFRYPEVSEDYIKAMNPEYIFLSSEPYPFQEKHVQEICEMLPSAKIMLVDGEMFSWYGSRLIKAPAYFNSLKLQ
jgi:ABC-type Fe3+-hydroxamate transport system substrate-binding protein